MENNPTKISIIIPNLHSPIINQTIESVLSQKTDLPFEVIVVGRDKWHLVETFDDVQFIETPTPVGAAEARNIGIQQAQGEWLFFIDSDCVAQLGWIKSFSDAFEDGWQVVGGGVKSPETPFWVLVYNLSMFHGELATQKPGLRRFFPTLNLAVHRQVIDKVGLMDTGLPRGQDIEWTARMTKAGFPILFKPEATVEHHPPRQDLETLQAYVRKSGYYTVQVRLRHPEVFRTPGLIKYPIVLKLFAPAIAGLTTLKIVLRTRQVRQNLGIVPYIYKQKISWCRGAAESLKEMRRKDIC